jgi:hypothetical protein
MALIIAWAFLFPIVEPAIAGIIPAMSHPQIISYTQQVTKETLYFLKPTASPNNFINFRFDDNGKVQLAEGKIFREVGGKYTEVGSFQFAARGSKEYQQAMARAEQNIRNGEALAQVKQADAVYSEKDTEGNTTRVVYMKTDASGNATVLASEHRDVSGKMKLLTYDTSNLGAGELSKGKIYTQDEKGKYGAQAAGMFVIKEMGIEQFSAIGKQIMQKLQAGQVGKAVVYQETMNNGATREVVMDKASGQVLYVASKDASGKQSVVVFGKANVNLGDGVTVKNFNSLNQKDQTAILGALPVMDKRDSSAMTAKLAMMQQGLQQAKMNKLMESMGFKLDAKSGENFFKLPDGTGVQILRMGEDASGSLVLEGRIMKSDGDGMKAVGEEVFITSGDSDFAKGIVGDTKGAVSVIIKVNGDKSEAILLDANQQIIKSVAISPKSIEQALSNLKAQEKTTVIPVKTGIQATAQQAIAKTTEAVKESANAVVDTVSSKFYIWSYIKKVMPEVAAMAEAYGIAEQVAGMLEGAVLGDFIKDASVDAWTLIGQIGGNLIPVVDTGSDVRDFGAAFKKLYDVQGKELGAWGNLGLNGVRFVPAIGLFTTCAGPRRPPATIHDGHLLRSKAATRYDS